MARKRASKNMRFLFIVLTFTFLFVRSGFAQDIVTVSGTDRYLIGNNISYLEEGPEKQLTIQDVINRQDFKQESTEIVNLGLTESYYWLKFTLVNKTNDRHLLLNIDQPNLTSIEFYQPDSTGAYKGPIVAGTNFPFKNRLFSSPNFLYYLNIDTDQSKTYYLRLKGHIPLVLPISVSKEDVVYKEQRNKNVFFGVYAGVIICMIMYNLFLMFSVRNDKSYLWYVLHTVFVGLTQLCFFGYAFQFFWPSSPWLANQSLFISTCFVSIFGIIFLQVFLNTKEAVPKLNKVFYGFFVLYGAIIVLSLGGKYVTAYQVMQPTQGFVALYILFVAFKLVKAGYTQARFYLLSWFLLMVGIIIFALKDYNLVPYNIFTSNIMLIGSAVQVLLLSFALGDKINILEVEKISSQEEALRISKENEKIIKEQNIILESRVNERTMALKSSNEELAKTLHELKETETQLVESEKMASLGQLTAGIAHEINNPINFVTSNVNPLRRDVDLLFDLVTQIEQVSISDAPVEQKQKEIEELKEELDFDYLKTEIGYLIKGIHDGASRTAEIVRGLRVFSRLDEDDLKKADINEGLDSTIVIVNHLLNGSIEIEKKYSGIPLVECFPGKLNQVFLNLMSNSIHAIDQKWGGAPGGKLSLSTWNDEANVFVSVKDNGIGMDEGTKKKLFEPFFTTKDVGEGTGLGLSIVYNTVRKHNGSIEVNAEPNEGSEFVIRVPIIHK